MNKKLRMAAGNKSSYEAFVQQNVKERDAVLKQFMTEFKEFQSEENVAKPRDSTPKKRVYKHRPRFDPLIEPRVTRSRSSSVSSTAESTPASSPKQLMIKFPFRKAAGGDLRFQKVRVFDEDFEDIDEVLKRTRKPTTNRATKHVITSVEDITDDDLDAVAVTPSEKVWHSELGSSCHQCRQKTLDRKTTCRSQSCVGVRGQFCGPCLRNRYGESAKEALLDPTWICPPCRGICNCSFCRRKEGYMCTGIMIHEAKELGFQSVRHYLESKTETETETGTDD